MVKKIINQSIASFLESTDFSFHAASDFIYEIKSPQVSIKDLVLSEKSKKQVQQVILEYKNIAKLMQFSGLQPTNKIILEGDSGCGKTTTALAIANALKKGIVIVNLSEIISSKLGETSKNLGKVFKYAEQNNYIIFLDEFDSLSKARNDDNELGEMKRLVNSIIQLLDFGSDRLMIIGATNYIENLDSAIKRRFEEVVSFTKPDINQIKTYLSMLEYFFEGKVKIGITKEMLSKLQGLDFFRIKTLINSIVKRKVISSSGKKIKIDSKDIVL